MITQTMMLISSNVGEDKSFRLIPTALDCPYAEIVYDTSKELLVIFGKTKN